MLVLCLPFFAVFVYNVALNDDRFLCELLCASVFPLDINYRSRAEMVVQTMGVSVGYYRAQIKPRRLFQLSPALPAGRIHNNNLTSFVMVALCKA